MNTTAPALAPLPSPSPSPSPASASAPASAPAPAHASWQIVLHRPLAVVARPTPATAPAPPPLPPAPAPSNVLVLYSPVESRAVVVAAPAHLHRQLAPHHQHLAVRALPPPPLQSSSSSSASSYTATNSGRSSPGGTSDAHRQRLPVTCPECGCAFSFVFNPDQPENPSANSAPHHYQPPTAAEYSESGERIDYFRILQICFNNDPANFADVMDGDDEMSSPSHPQIYPVASTESIPSLHKVTGTSTNGNNNNSSSSSSSNNLSESCFNQGYYDRFFVEVKKLGRGLRGSVFLVQHVLDTVFLGEYAVKSIPVGVSHSWLVRQLQEVHLLERLRHPNIIHYKHAWIENRQLSVFAPEVPCLFILMELANGGNLEEYIYLQHPDSSLTTFYTSTENFQQQHEITDRATRLKILRQQQRVRKRAAAAWSSEESLRARMFGGIGMDSDGRRVRYLTTRQIWSLFIDISEGLAHLHRNGIIHRDLKPPNLLLRFRDLKDPDEIPRVLISDFGECEVLGEKVQRVETPSARPVRTGATGTLEFMCPELLERDPVTGAYCHDHSVKGDMFSLGVVLYFLCYSRVPYSQVEDVDLLREEILRFHRVTFPTDGHERRVPAELNRLIDRLLARDPALRPTMDEVVSMCRLAGAAPQPAAAAATPAAIPKQNTATATAVAAAASTLSKPAPLAAAAAAAATAAATPSALEWKGMSIV